MKSYDEMAKSVLERRDRHREKQSMMKKSISLAVMCVCLTLVIGVGGWQVAMQMEEPNYISPDNTSETDNTGIITETDPPIFVTEQPEASHILDTTPGHDISEIPVEIPGDATVIHIPNSSGAMQDICIPITTEGLFENADLVVIGEFLGTDGTEVTENMQFISDGRVNINEIKKGEIETEEPLTISYYGGMVTVAHIVSKVPSERLEKYGWLSMTKEEQQNFVVTYSSSLTSADLVEGETYLLFLAQNEYGYFVMCDSYGARRINNEGQAYNVSTRLYEEIPTLAKYSSLEEAKTDETYGEYLPEYIPDGFWVESIKHYKDENSNYLSGLWSRGYDDIRWKISYADEYTESRRTSADDLVNYDLSLYPIPRAESVPDELREIVDNPVFLAEEVNLDVIYRRAYWIDDGEDSGYRINFSVLVGDVVIEIRTEGIPPETIYDMINNIIK
ncbi:MAG: hypothetical protein E7627_02825 [Ruminococcaceae bacterium]|nr:hypothetical protein [Oscillospiraceae bacterium]